MSRSLDRIVRMVQKGYERAAGNQAAPAFALQLTGRDRAVFGRGEPAATVVVNDRRGAAALATMDAMAVCEAYLAGALDVIGDIKPLLALRNMFADRHPVLSMLRFARPLLAGQEASDKAWIRQHYDRDPEFYLTFLDSRHRAYSHGYFAHDDEPLEDAITRKLDTAIEAIGAKAGDRVLDIGGGWGSFNQHAGSKGIRVTSLTISPESEAFIRAIITGERLPTEVRREHLMEHRPAEPYDAIVNLGVTEHLPDYKATLAKYATLLKPGGRVFLDASATRVKYDVSAFFERYIFRGNGSPLCLHDYLREVARSPFEVEAVHNDRRNYLLTARHWAERLDASRERIERRWGKAAYRTFQLYLWGCVDGFERDEIQAYHWVMRLRG
ncbi:MAG: Cyclopropane-fatty-acyl-phospholipid synthase [uncultured Gemmatimonadetes bacterium]|uniref:Cyclopropane-fatty-acyl-phospholipid synthase n=1 Tax=uncultured Gemmatimonadota bacterium TaxID=203437 RepID=A0A6J4KZX0_9BACT|nr:MAG: Cyclopropane-fatty-acyl-phospholipid synthase [uncultured Gemmatimonadota bacterium]